MVINHHQKHFLFCRIFTRNASHFWSFSIKARNTPTGNHCLLIMGLLPAGDGQGEQEWRWSRRYEYANHSTVLLMCNSEICPLLFSGWTWNYLGFVVGEFSCPPFHSPTTHNILMRVLSTFEFAT